MTTTMTTTAFLFPGQGSQHSGMGRRFYESWPEFRSVFDRLDETVSYDLTELVFDGSSDRLRETKYTQPAVFAVGAAAAEAVERRFGVRPDITAGHSLGHLTALVSAGCLDPVDGMTLVEQRGRLMQQAGEENGPGTMVAALFVDPDAVAAACENVPDVSVGVYNGARQTVISGATAQVAKVRETLEANHRVRFEELDVGTAFHSPLMCSASEAYTSTLASTPFDTASVPVVSDVSTEPYVEPSVAREDLATQLESPVRWMGVVKRLADRGVTQYVEFPPSGTLTKLVERAGVSGEVLSLETPADAAEVFTDV